MPAIRRVPEIGSDARQGCYRHRRMSAGRAAMWIIASGIALAGVVVFAVNGLDGIPGDQVTGVLEKFVVSPSARSARRSAEEAEAVLKLRKKGGAP